MICLKLLKSTSKKGGNWGGGGTGSRGVLIPVLKAWKVLEIVKLKFQDFLSVTYSNGKA